MRCHILCTGCGHSCGHRHASIDAARRCPAFAERPCPEHSLVIVDDDSGREVATVTNPSGGIFLGNLDALARANSDFRRVVYTGAHSQLVVMSLRQGEEIGTERHEAVEQVFVVVAGHGEADLTGRSIALNPGSVLVVPPGTTHNVRATSRAGLRLWTSYTPPNHIPSTRHRTRSEAEQDTRNEAYSECIERGDDPATCLQD